MNTEQYAYEPTVILPASGEAENSRVVPVNPMTRGDVTARFERATDTLLRDRLYVMALVWLSVVIVFETVHSLTGVVSVVEAIVKGVVIATLAAVAILLGRNRSMAGRTVRWIEFLIVGMAMTEIVFDTVMLTDRFARENRFDAVLVLWSFTAMTTSLFIAVYGMFIPSTWRRTLVMTVLMAAGPSITIVLLDRFHPALGREEMVPIGFKASIPLFMLTMAAVATTGAHIVHRTRRQVEDARRYGQYRLLYEIGRGGMGIVYRAEHRMLKRPAAIKMIRAESAYSPAAIDDFEREVQISATLSHWNTVQIYDYGRTEGGDLYYVMEYLEGETLAHRLHTDGPLDPETIVRIANQLCDGLHEAHERDIVHRDLKPSNIFLSKLGGRSEIVKILDFGLATRISEPSDNRRKGIFGTPLYMSPEQSRGDRLDHRSDIYALGCILFQCLTGQPPFVGSSTTDVLHQHRTKTPDMTAAEIRSPELRRCIEICLRKDPDFRFQSVDEVTAAFAELQSRFDRSAC